LPPLSPDVASAVAGSSGVALSSAFRADVGLQKNAGVTAPVPLNAVTAHYTTEARKARITGICVVRVTVDVDGKPRDPEVTKSLDPGLDQEALKAVMQYRFKPAMRGAQPVPVRIALEISFKLY
jgi:periplasmic protein TonB